jgi:hypothetical protein
MNASLEEDPILQYVIHWADARPDVRAVILTSTLLRNCHSERSACPERSVGALEETYVGASIQENWEAMFKTIDLFQKVAIEVGEHLGFAYPRDGYASWSRRGKQSPTSEGIATPGMIYHQGS